MTEVKIEYRPRPWAREFHNSDKKRIVLVLHRRAGKTVACINHLIRECFKSQDLDQRYAYIAPTYKQAKNVAWDILKRYAKKVPYTKFNEAELRCDFPNGARITLYGADNPDALRGIGLWGVVFDEYSQQPSNIYSEIILPTLADHNGFAIWIGTPKGKNDFYNLYQFCGFPKDRWLGMSKEERESIEKDWFKLKLGVSQTNLVEENYLKMAKRNMTEDEYEQEFECSFESSLKGAFYGDELSNAYKEKRITRVPYEPILPVITAWDWGMNDSTAIGFFQHVGKERRMIDYYENNGHSIEHYISVLFNKGYVYDYHIVPHDFQVKEFSSEGRTRLEVAESLGLRNMEVLERFGFNDGVNAAKTVFPQLYIDEAKCEKFLDALSQYQRVWDDKKGEFSDKEQKDWTNHAADMLRYYALGSRGRTEEEHFDKISIEY